MAKPYADMAGSGSTFMERGWTAPGRTFRLA